METSHRLHKPAAIFASGSGPQARHCDRGGEPVTTPGSPDSSPHAAPARWGGRGYQAPGLHPPRVIGWGPVQPTSRGWVSKRETHWAFVNLGTMRARGSTPSRVTHRGAENQGSRSTQQAAEHLQRSDKAQGRTWAADCAAEEAAEELEGVEGQVGRSWDPWGAVSGAERGRRSLQ